MSFHLRFKKSFVSHAFKERWDLLYRDFRSVKIRPFQMDQRKNKNNKNMVLIMIESPCQSVV